MKVFVAGATGVLGRRLIQEFRARGHIALGLVRSEKGERLVRSLGGQPRRADLFDADALARAAEDADAVIHAATAIVAKLRATPEDWAMNDRIRREGTQALTLCAGLIGARVYLQQSIVWVARPADGGPFDEDSPAQPEPVMRSALDGELIAREAGEKHGFCAGVLRCGSFYAPDAAHTRMLGEGLARRKFPIIGAGDAIWACLHADDAASAFLAAAEGGKSGRWHVVDNHPVTAREFLTTFAERLGARPPRSVPVWLARLVVGSQAVKFLTVSTQTSNARFRAEFGWAPRFPSYSEGLDQVVAAWRAEDFLPRTN